MRLRPTSTARHGLLACILLAGFAAVAAAPVLAQGWSWPWEAQPAPRRLPAPQTVPQQYDRRYDPPQAPQNVDPGAGGNICLQLEQRLANEVNRGQTSGNDRAAAADQLRQAEGQVRTLEARLDRGGCWEEFFFQRTLRNTRTCVSTYKDLQSQRQLAQDLRSQLQNLASDNRQALQDDIMRALARNRCGPAYEQEARRLERSNPFSSFFQDYDGSGDRGIGNTYRGVPFATYRTLCVRLCDGYYFPVSFSTLPTYFERDASACQSKCAAPAVLFYHQNPGGSIDQMISVADNATYKQLPTAFLYRKEYIKGCSCKAEEYVAQGVAVDQRADTNQQRQFSPVR